VKQPVRKEEPGDAPRIASDAEAAEYISDLLGQLERLARAHGLVALQFLLKTCREEASRLAAGR
jgi:hypothetical protein